MSSRSIAAQVIVAATLSASLVRASVVESIVVPVDGSVVHSEVILEDGVVYVLRASGTAIVCNVCGPQIIDAEYTLSRDTGEPVDAGCGTVDLGIAIDDFVIDLDRSPQWGDYSPDHVYEIPFVGGGSTIAFQYHDCMYSDNEGALLVEIMLVPVSDGLMSFGVLKAAW